MRTGKALAIDFDTLRQAMGPECEFIGNKTIICSGMSPVTEAAAGDITWIKPGLSDEAELINRTGASCILCSPGTFRLYSGSVEDKLFVIHDDPKLLSLWMSRYIMRSMSTAENGPAVHPTAIIDDRCRLGADVRVGAYSVLGACDIGDGTLIAEHVRIHDGVKMGRECIVREHASVGGAGFGYHRGRSGALEHLPHLGEVVIGDRVHLFPFVNVDKGTLGATTIGSGTVVDHYVHVGHNVKVGGMNVIAANVVLSGGSVIGDSCFIGVGTLVKEKVTIGSGVTTGIGTVVIRDIPDDEVWVGNPGRFLKRAPKA